jgi:gluconolactonase
VATVSAPAPAAQATAGPGAATAAPMIERLDPALDALVSPGARIEKLADGFDWTEGPVWRRDGDKGHLLFSDIPRNTIYKWKAGEGISIFLRPAGYSGPTPPGRELGTNGLTLDAAGHLVVADHGNRMIARLNDSLATKTVVVDRFEGKRLNSPNDLVFHPNGDLFFTDPPYGLRRLDADTAKELAFNGVYRVTRSGAISAVVRDLTFPNGIALSPDGRTLYVAVSDGRAPKIMAYDLQADGTVTRGRVFFDAMPLARQRRRGAPDGLKVDVQGNLFATGPGGVLVLSPQGKHLGTIMTGDLTSNCAFGDDGSTLYMTVNHQLMRVRTNTKGVGF